MREVWRLPSGPQAAASCYRGDAASSVRQGESAVRQRQQPFRGGPHRVLLSGCRGYSLVKEFHIR